MFKGVFLYLNLFLFLGFAANAKPLPIVRESIFQVGQYDYTYGPKDAKVQIIEYFSLSCPHCEHFYTSIFPKIKEKYIDTGKITWIKRSYTMDQPSMKGTLLLACVGKENYETYLNILLTRQASWAYQNDFEDRLRNIAGLGGMSKDAFQKCMNNQYVQKQLNAVLKEGKTVLKITGTPALYLNKKKVDAYNFRSISKLIDEALEKN
jgi:protein-disulfide isomerase